MHGNTENGARLRNHCLAGYAMQVWADHADERAQRNSISHARAERAQDRKRKGKLIRATMPVLASTFCWPEYGIARQASISTESSSKWLRTPTVGSTLAMWLLAPLAGKRTYCADDPTAT